MIRMNDEIGGDSSRTDRRPGMTRPPASASVRQACDFSGLVPEQTASCD
jgi:hypothetical protein